MALGQKIAAQYYDGETAKDHEVNLGLIEILHSIEDVTATLSIKGPGITQEWPLDELTVDEVSTHLFRIHHLGGNGNAYINLTDRQFSLYLKNHKAVSQGHKARQWSSIRKIAPWVVGAVASAVFLYFLGIPMLADAIANNMPPSVDERIGKNAKDQVKRIFLSFNKDKNLTCTDDPDDPGMKAMNRLAANFAKLVDSPFTMQVEIIPLNMPNAFALPGGYIMFTSKMIEEIQNSDEFASVLAHEVAHVQKKHTLRLIFRMAGTSYVIGAILGDITGGGAVAVTMETLTQMQFGRSFEEEADIFSHEIMLEIGRSPEALATLFQRLFDEHENEMLSEEEHASGGGEKKGDQGMTWLSTHPANHERIAMAKDYASKLKPNPTPALSTEEWQAVKAICKKTEDSK